MKEALKMFGITVSIISSAGSLVTFNDYSRALFMEKVFGIKETEKLTEVEVEKLKHQAEKAELATKIAQLETEQLKIKQEKAEAEAQQLKEKKEKAEEEANQLRIKQEQAEAEQLQKKSTQIDVLAEIPKTQDSSAEIARLQQEAIQAKLENEQLKTKLESEKKQIVQTKIQNKADLSSKSIIEKLIFYASKNAGIGYEDDIQGLVVQLEALETPQKGNDKEARKLNNKGLLVLTEDENFDEAIRIFSEANKLDPSNPDILANLALTYMRSDDLKKAKGLFLKTLEIAPTMSNAWFQLGNIFALDNEENKAIACYINTYRFSKNIINTHKFMQKTNSEEDSPILTNVMAKAITVATKTFADLKSESNTTVAEDKKLFSTGFNCNKATKSAEITVCENQELASLSVQNIRLFNTLKAINPDTISKTMLIESVKQRYSCNTDVNCLKEAYKKTIGEYSRNIEQQK
jgi:tetratricopeptide (TPR) repeat protein